MALKLAPFWNGQQFFDNEGKPLVGGQLLTFTAGSQTTLRTTFSSSSGTVTNPNPIILDAAGRNNYPLWLVEGGSYNFVLKDARNNLIASIDGVMVEAAGSGGGGGGGTSLPPSPGYNSYLAIDEVGGLSWGVPPLPTYYSVFSAYSAGLVPSPGFGSGTRYLREDGQWFEPAGSGGGGGTPAAPTQVAWRDPITSFTGSTVVGNSGSQVLSGSYLELQAGVPGWTDQSVQWQFTWYPDQNSVGQGIGLYDPSGNFTDQAVIEVYDGSAATGNNTLAPGDTNHYHQGEGTLTATINGVPATNTIRLVIGPGDLFTWGPL